MASIVRTFREDLNSSLNCCDTVLKLFWRPLAVSLQSYLKTPRIKALYIFFAECNSSYLILVAPVFALYLLQVCNSISK